jgi:hypothetical protein
VNALPPLPASDLLIADRPLLIMPRLVALVGLNEAIVLQQVRYWLGDDLRPQVRDGRRWVYNSYRAWQERNFPFWQVDTVKRAFLSLERQGLLLSANYNQSRRNHTKWYSVNFVRLLEHDRLCRAAVGAPSARATREAGAQSAAAPAGPAAAGPPPIPATDLLLDENPLVILPRLAARVGFDEAIILQQVRYWLADVRKPLVREGRRWVRFSQEEWQKQLPFRSAPTIARAFRKLEKLGLLISSDRFNSEPGDRTKSYTIDFDQVAALESPGAGRAQALATGRVPIDQNAPSQQINLPRPIAQNAPIQSVISPGPEHQASPVQDIVQHRPLDRQAPTSTPASPSHRRDLPPTVSETSPETLAETRTETQQQRRGGHGATSPVVVAEVDPSGALVSRLAARGITPGVARRLVATHGGVAVEQQIEVFDWIREQEPDDPRHSPGRLRRMIEEGWTPPADFIPAMEQARRVALAAAAAEEQRRRHEAAREEERRRRAGAEAEYAALLGSLGLHAEDQAQWRALVESPQRLPTVFCHALFYAPREMTPPVVILRHRGDQELAMCTAYAKHRAEIEQRLCDRFPHYALTRFTVGLSIYVAYEDALSAFQAPPEVGHASVTARQPSSPNCRAPDRKGRQ